MRVRASRGYGPEPPPPLCAFNEVHPLEFRPLVPPAGVLVEARLLPAVELPPQRWSPAGWFLGALGRIFKPGAGRREVKRTLGLRSATKEG